MDGKEEANPFGDILPKDAESDAGDPSDNGGEGGDGGGSGSEGKDGEGKDDKGDDAQGKKTPTETIAELSRKIGELEALHGTKDENIREMREKLKGYERGDIQPKGKKDEPEVLFKEIKFSKDLPKEKQEEMTETELALHDQVATLQDGMNKLFGQLQQQSSKVEKGEEVNISDTVREEALALAGNDKKAANEIIEAFNLLDKDVKKGADKAKLKELVAMANRMRPDYKPPKENETKRGGPIKKGGQGTDPFGVDKIVDEARKGSNGSYEL